MRHTVQKIKLKNGSNLLLINIPNSSTIFFGCGVRAGFYFAPKNKYELPHLLEHLAFQGNKTYPDYLKFTFEIEKNGAYQNASTSSSFIRYYYIAGNDEINEIMKLALAQLTGPLFKDEDIKNEKQVIRQELERKLEDNRYLCSEKLDSLIVSNLPFIAKRLKDLSSTSRDEILNYYRKYHTSYNTFFVLAGEFQGDTIKKVKTNLNLQLRLKKYPKGKSAKIPYPELGDYHQKIISTDKKSATQDYFSFAFIYQKYEIKMSRTLQVIGALYNKGGYSRLHYLTRKKGLSYGPRSGYGIGHDYSEFYVADMTAPDKSLELFEVCLKELKEIYNGNYSDEELERARGYIAGAIEKNSVLPSDFANWYGADFMYSDPLRDLNEYIKSIKEVTRDDIKQVCRKFFKSDSWVLSILGPDVKKKEKEYRKIIEKYFG